jgi:hypothetical protein
MRLPQYSLKKKIKKNLMIYSFIYHYKKNRINSCAIASGSRVFCGES